LSVPAITSAASIELVISGNDVLDCEGIAYQARLVLGVAPSTTFLLQLDNENSTQNSLPNPYQSSIQQTRPTCVLCLL
jgi:hypothetical protein